MPLSLTQNSPFIPSAAVSLVSHLSLFKDKFLETFPESAADIATLASNPNCSCRFKVEKIIKDNTDKVFNLIKDLYNENLSLQNTIDSIISNSSFQTASGKVFTIKKNSESWYNFYLKLVEEKFMFGNFSVVDRGDELDVYFL